MNNTAKKLIMYITGAIMALGVVMFIMDCIKWNGTIVPSDGYVPTFFDVMFGGKGSEGYHYAFVTCPGMLVLFIVQIIVSLAAVVLIVLFLLKKIDTKKTYLGIGIVGILAIVCAILSFCTPQLINQIIATEGCKVAEAGELISVKGGSALAYGSIVYGSVMTVTGLVALSPYVVTYCLKK